MLLLIALPSSKQFRNTFWLVCATGEKSGYAKCKMLVYINDDGSARELTEADKKYVDTEFSPLDGARPYIKSHYSQRTALGEIRGYLPRTEVPEGVPINPAPPESEPQQQTPQTVAGFNIRIDPET